MRKKKILHIVEAFGGGVYTYLVGLANKTCEEFDVVIAYSKRKQTPQNFKNEFNKNIKFIEVKNFSRNIGLQDFKAFSEVKKIINEEKPDIVHLHSSKAGAIGRFAIKDKNIKMFYTPHGYSFYKEDDSKLKRLVYKSVEKIAAKYNGKCTTIACSEGEWKQTLKINNNCEYVNNGINTEAIDKIIHVIEKNPNKNKKIRICTVGRIDTQKNPKLFNEIAKTFPEVEFVWIGDGKQKDFLTSKNITITGWTTNDEVIKNVEKCDIFLLPSLWEGLPMSLLEAMYLGKVCIVSNISGNNNVIQNGVNGFVCNDINEYCEAITNVINLNTKINEISKNAQDSIIKEYNLGVMSEKYKNIYKKYEIES